MQESAGRPGPAYRGRDRRVVPVDTTLPVGPHVPGRRARGGDVGHRDRRRSATPAWTTPTFALPVVRLDVGASLLAAVTAVACFFRWRLEGTASAFWAGLVGLRPRVLGIR